MRFTHYVEQPWGDNVGMARKIRKLDDKTTLCFVRLHAMKTVCFVAAVETKSLKPLEVIQ